MVARELQCDPNLIGLAVWVECHAAELPHFALFASRDIAAGEELTFDYSRGCETRKKMKKGGAKGGDTKHANVATLELPEKCYCGAPQCRQTVFM